MNVRQYGTVEVTTLLCSNMYDLKPSIPTGDLELIIPAGASTFRREQSVVDPPCWESKIMFCL